jgi:lauroyl/myristoyl acyltransferase
MFVASAATRLVLRLKLPVAWAAFYFLRLCERLLPPSVLSLLLWPPAAAWDLLHVRQRTPLTCWRRFPASWRHKRWRFLRQQGLGLYHSQFFCIWPDRLCGKRWLNRCRLEGAGNLIGAREGDPGVVLASLHFGPYELLPYWLRAYGIVTTSVRVKPPDSLKSLTDYQCSLSPPADAPVFLYAEDLIPLPRFSHVRKILGPGRRLLVMVDVAQGIQVDVPFEDRIFHMSTGAIRLATMANAELIPCLIAEISTWKFVIRFGAPVPRQYLGNVPDMQAIGAHLLKEFSQVVSRYPEQCKMRLARAMRPLAENGAKRSAVSHTVTLTGSV